MTNINGPTLTDSKGMGGIIAQDGFDYQLWAALERLPGWLRNPCFEGFAFESLEDFEARFFAPHSPHRHFVDRFQAKSGMLTKAELVEVFKSFATFNQAHPNIARVQTLVTPQLPTNLAWLARDTERVRRARPFYSPFSEIVKSSNNKLIEDLIGEFGEEIGCHVANSVEINRCSFPDRSHAETAFCNAMNVAFPSVNVTMGKMKSVFVRLTDLIGCNRGMMLTRARLLNVLAEELGGGNIVDGYLSLHIHSNRTSLDIDAVEIDARPFAGGDIPYPKTDLWNAELLSPLKEAACWAQKQNYRRISLSGNYRISTAFALGWSFRSVAGFDIEIPTRSGRWITNEYPPSDATPLPWNIRVPQRLCDGRLIVTVGVLRDPSIDLQDSFGNSDEGSIFSATLKQGLSSGVEAQLSVHLLKDAIARTVSQLHPTGINLYYAGPVALAIALGHQWNAFPLTQVYEFIPTEQRYLPTVILG